MTDDAQALDLLDDLLTRAKAAGAEAAPRPCRTVRRAIFCSRIAAIFLLFCLSLMIFLPVYCFV